MTNEEKLRDAIIRSQVYLEGVKLDTAEEVESAFENLGVALAAILAGLGIVKLSELSIKSLRKLITKLRASITRRFNAVNRKVQRIVTSLSKIELQIQTALHKTFFEAKRALPTIEGVLSRVRSAVIPGVGGTIGEMLGGNLGRLREEITRMIRGGHANDESIQDLIQRITGTRGKRYRDGWIAKTRRSVRSAVATALQHAASLVGSMTGAAFFERYQWVSVLDERTTDICTDRDGKIYVYGSGPVPPAHYNCRSTTVPYSEETTADWRKTDWFEWATSQPREILDDMIGRTASAAMRADGASVSDFPRLTTVRRLSLANYATKFNNLLDE